MHGKPLHVTCITTSRADFSLQRWPMREIAGHKDMRLSIIAGGGHLAPSQGATIDEIRQDGFVVDETVDMYIDGDSAQIKAAGAALATMGVGQALTRLAPDWVMLLGDRFEVLGAATAAALHRLPICHLCGGDVTEGASDDAFRNAISKLSHLHCTTSAEASENLRYMGEEDWRIFQTGSPGLDSIHHVPKLARSQMFQEIGLPDHPQTALVTLHPSTLKDDLGLSELHALLAALDSHPDLQLLITGTNADSGGAEFNAALKDFAARRPGAVFRQSLGQNLYVNAMRQMSAVIGNSSSGLYEAPSFGLPTVNIGDRQKGRLRAASVFDCGGTAPEIAAAIAAARAFSGRDIVNPYGDGHSAARIVSAMLTLSSQRGQGEILAKRFVRYNQGQRA